MIQHTLRGGRIITSYDDIDEFNQYEDGEAVFWKEFRPGTRWVITDDGFVHEVIDEKTITHGGKLTYTFRTAAGTVGWWYERFNSTGEVKEGVATKHFCGNPQTIKNGFASDNKPKERKLSSREKMFARLIARETNLSRGRLFEIYKDVFRRSKKEPYIKARAIGLFNSTRIQNVIREETLKMMDDVGVTEEWIVNRIRDIVEAAESNYSDKARSLTLLAKIRGMLEQQTQKSSATLQIEGAIDPRKLLAIRDEEAGKVDITE